jgi:hypothetical protein
MGVFDFSRVLREEGSSDSAPEVWMLDTFLSGILSIKYVKLQ